jgi:hypothetical protein
MKTYRFVTRAHLDVFAETIEEATEHFNEIKQKGLSLKIDLVSRIEVKDKNGEYIPVDIPLRAGDLDVRKEALIRPSA